MYTENSPRSIKGPRLLGNGLPFGKSRRHGGAFPPSCLGEQSARLCSAYRYFVGVGTRGAGRGGGGGTHAMHGRSRMKQYHKPSYPYNAGTEHVRFPLTRQTLLAPSAKRYEEFGESHEL